MSKSTGSSLKTIFDHSFYDLCFLVIAITCCSFSSKFPNLLSIFTLLFHSFHKTRIMNYKSLSLDSDSEESPSLTTMDDNNTLTVVVGWNYVRRLFPLQVFLTV